MPALTLRGRWSESHTSFLYLNRSLSLSSCATRNSGRLCAATRPCGLDSARPANITAGGIATAVTAHIQLSRRHFYGEAKVFWSIEISWHDDGTILRQFPHELLSLSSGILSQGRQAVSASCSVVKRMASFPFLTEHLCKQDIVRRECLLAAHCQIFW